MLALGNSWDTLLKEEFEKDYYLNLRSFLKQEYSTKTIYPDKYDIYNALRYTDYDNVKVVIIGQDPYHGPNQAHGLCFSVKKGIVPPPSLKNIYKELSEDVGFVIPNHGELTQWAKQGVLLLNATLTVQAGLAASHKGKGWEILTDKIIEIVNQKKEPVVFLLWGGFARAKKALITNKNHLVLECAHPSPLSAYNGFFDCRHFSKTNEFLISKGIEPVNWQIED